MILVASQRGGAGNLAAHLLNDRDNDHVELLEVRGFLSSDLPGALAEIDAISKGTQCRQPLFSLSLNPPKNAEVGIDKLVDAANRAEESLGLKDQPRAIVVHEKEGRRHIHVVWSRIDIAEMKAVRVPFFKNRLMTLAKELYLENGWSLPDGHKTNGWKNPLNFSLAEWQQAKRLDLDPRELKQIFRAAWEQSDNRASFRNALEEHGYFLAKGNQRGFVAVDLQGETFSLSRWADVKTKDLTARLGAPDTLPSVEEVKEETQRRLSQQLRSHLQEFRRDQTEQMKPLTDERREMVAAHRDERKLLAKGQERRWAAETKARAERLRKGLPGLFDRLTGKMSAIRRSNDREAFEGYARDRQQKEHLFFEQMKDRQALQKRIEALRRQHRQALMQLLRRVATILRLNERPEQERGQFRRRIRSPGLDYER